MLKLLSSSTSSCSRNNSLCQKNIFNNVNILHKNGYSYNPRTFSSTPITRRQPRPEPFKKSHRPTSTSHPSYPKKSTSGGHPRFAAYNGQAPRERRKTSLSPSEEFMEMRNNSMNYARSLGLKKKAQHDLGATPLELGEEIPKRLYSQKAPKSSSGDVVDLFSPDTLQNRGVLPGDFVEIRRGGKVIFGIFRRSFDQNEGRLHSTSITQGDGILEHRTVDVTFRVPGYAFLDKVVAEVGLWDPEVNPEAPPSNLGRIAITFADNSKQILGLNYTKFNTIYDVFWHKRKRTSLSTLEAAKYVFGKENNPKASPLTAQQIYATHLYLTQDESLNKFTPAVSLRWTGEFSLQPPDRVSLSTTVIDWIRKNDRKILQFQEKSKALIEGYRKGDKSSWKEITFTESDRTLIEFVKQTTYAGHGDVFVSPLLTYLPRLLRPTTFYDDIEPTTGFNFLNEIGVWPQWYNMEINRSAYSVYSSAKAEETLMKKISSLNRDSLQSDFEADIQRMKEEHTSNASAEAASTPESVSTTSIDSKKTLPITSSPLVLQDPLDFYRRDICDSIRHDFGQQAVYAIDDPSASELDDAFSIEPVPISTLTPIPSTWVHVHVADPTSILPPGHKMSRLAASRIQTVYLPDGTWPMIPREFTEESLSLKNDGKPKKVMTFSARINNETAEILESKIRPGIVRNLITLNYDDVDEVMSWDRIQGGKEEGARVQGSTMSMPETKILDREYYRASIGSLDTNDKSLVSAIQSLQVIAQSHQDSRIRMGGFNFNMGRPLVELTPYPIKPVAEAGWEKPIDYTQWQEPEISCRLDPSLCSPSRIMVAEYMILAGRVAAKYTQENNIPVLYRNQSLPADKYRDMFTEKLRGMTNPSTGMVSLVDMLPLRPYVPGAEIATTSQGHFSLGLPEGYSKVTSPLRRYTDMICHWQIKSHLLGQENPFSLKELTPMAGMIRERERILGMMESRSVKFWLFEMLRRKIELGQPVIMEGLYLNATADGYNGMSTQLGFQAVVKAEPEEVEGLGVGDKVMFEVIVSNPQRPYILVKHLQSKP
ncbi:hypothetical protein BGZ76_001082 [Entomortierella beljakovae]|nr:hypothetical protein BGZ76_001082 [Entomortierella beljakovae]